MGNCQAIDAASLVIQHPTGRVERLYWPVTASEVMRTNPGYYVALIITLCLPEEEKNEKNSVHFTRVKLLRPTDTLALGQAYRLITSQEVMKALRERKKKELKSSEKPQRMNEKQGSGCETKARRLESGSVCKTEARRLESGSVCETEARRLESGSVCETEARKPESEKMNQAAKHEKHQQRTTPSALARSRPWRPSLQSISEAGI